MQLPSTFNARAFQPATVGGAGNLPVGEYPVMIVDSEIKANSNNDGGFIALTLQATQGDHVGATGVWRLGIFNANQKTVEIAQRQLSSLCHVTGVYDVSDTAQLHGKEFVVVVALDTKPGQQEQYPGSTKVQGVKDMAGNDPGKAGNGAKPAQPAPFAAPPAPAAAAPAAWAPPAAAPAPAAAAWAPAAPAAPAPAAAGWTPGAAAAPAAGAPPWVTGAR